MGEVPYIIFK